jgi:DNA replication licensing factor MCM4
MRFCESVEVEDVVEANRLIREALKESAVRFFSSFSFSPPPSFFLLSIICHSQRRLPSLVLLERTLTSPHHSQTDPLTGLIDLDLLGGQSTHQRKLRGDLRREVVALLSATTSSTNKGLKFADLTKQLEAQSSLPIDNSELSEVIRGLEGEGSVRVSGAGHSRTVKLVGGAQQVEV